MKNTYKRAAWLVLGVFLAGCAAGPSPQDVAAATQKVLQSSFRDQGIAKTAWLVQDASNKNCSEAQGAALDDKLAKAIETANLETVKMPTDGKFIGDWREGEKIAQNGRGMTWTDPAGSANGGSCYNCHQISKEELSFGSIGPSLYNYGKLRGVANPAAADSKPIVDYTWGKLWNAKAYNACSGMPRFGHAGILNETQLRHVMALLLDPQSPVNK
ncbi:MAG TPA: sulfur oxidation c-type cytochrome SoxX [Polaromonas sp.]|uniref:sulfur oxidation c-type cytochrome SoxX n=1 Tax=Polaromonas sp. TaxID=1869339 RepID=UPI002D4AE3B3|nr:sulfur oxidation c-type cytochrome SoxX [Polaromonas sp.]HYW57910.1 sulfur oxidation c-type cytochrome SoxX [Polaromonas sp.]